MGALGRALYFILCHSLALTAPFAIVAVAIRYIFLATCLGDTVDGGDDARPYQSDAMVFGTLVTWCARVAIPGVFSRNGIGVIAPGVIYAFITVCYTAFCSVVWKVVEMDATTYLATVPMLSFVCVFGPVACVVVVWRSENSVANNIFAMLATLFAYSFLSALDAAMYVTFLVFVNERYVRETPVVSLDTLLTFSFTGVGIPLIKLLLLKGYNYAFSVDTRTMPATAAEEKTLHKQHFVLKLQMSIVWSALENLLVLRSPTDALYFSSSVTGMAMGVIERVAVIYRLRRKKRRMVEVEEGKQEKKAVDEKVQRTLAVAVEERPTKRVSAMQLEPLEKRVEPVVGLLESPDRRMEPTKKYKPESEQGIYASEGIQAVKYKRIQAKIGNVVRQPTFKTPSSSPSTPVMTKKSSFQIIPDSSLQSTTTITIPPSPAEPRSQMDLPLPVPTDEPVPATEPLFVPLDSITYAYCIQLIMTLADVTGRLMSLLSTLLLISCYPFPNWTSKYHSPSPEDLCIRSFTTLAASLIFNWVMSRFEIWAVGVDYGAALECVKGAGVFTWDSVFFLVSAPVTVLGDLIVSDTGVYIANELYLLGRKG
ncbi:hypothetical protein HK101_009012 [Irineochytrium annulatum]|nr:hypothetical protein HK101_009012 [Irineochytrium annulatum]